MNFFDKETYTQEDIEFLIKENFEEGRNLEFKRSESLEKTSKCTNEMAKDVSAIANSSGGIIVYGIDEKNTHKASELSFIDGEVISKEWIESVLAAKIQRRIKGLEIHAIRYNNDVKKSIYLVKIPESQDAPHMMNGNKYYKRYEFEAKPMYEDEIRALYFKEQTPELSIENVAIGINSEDEIEIFIYVENTSKVLEKYFKIELHFDHNMYRELNPTYNTQNVYSKDLKGKTLILSIKNQHPIFPFETLSVNCLRIDIELLNRFISNNEKLEFDYKLHYSAASIEYTINVKEQLKNLISEYAPMRQNQKR